MKAPPETSRRLRLELLETRTLLAADPADPFGLIADFNLAAHALSGTGDYQASFSTTFGNHQLVITGSASSSLTIDLAQLPSFITDLDISSFGSVTVTGTDHVDNLILSGIGSVAASGLSVDAQVVAKDVGSLSLAYVGGHTVVTGSAMSLTIQSFGVLGDVLSEVGTLTFTTDASHVDIFAIPNKANPVQTLRLTDASEVGRVFWHADSGSTVHVILPPIDSGGSDPETPPSDTGGTGSNSGGGTTDPATPGTDPGSLVIVTVPLDEATRTFLEQLHVLLHSSDSGSSQKLLDLLNTNDDSTVRRLGPLITGDLTALSGGGLSPAVPIDDFSRGPGTAVTPQPEVSKFVQSMPEQMIWSAQDPILVKSRDRATNDLPDGLALANLVNVDVSWPLALPMADLPRRESSRVSGDDETRELSVGDRVQALGTYIIERVTAEFSPGQQSLVLLVDPQPSRSASSARKPEIERNALAPVSVAPTILYV